jgi:acetylornithine deacetylase/succinyl-diaminopimelate desuccinylase-like protein
MRDSDDLASTIAMLETLVGYDTVSSKTNLPLIEHVEGYLAGLGIAFTRVPNAEGDRAALHAFVGPAVDGGVLLSGHTDVVPVKGQSWTSDPFALRRDRDRLYGRGTCDMKGFDAICLAMLPVFQKAKLKKPIHILLSYDEEVGCLGSLDTIARLGVDLPKPAVVIVGEPTEMAVVDGHKSISTYETTVHGKEAHSSNPRLGASAIEAACALMSELYALQATLEREGDPSGLFDPGFSTVHVGTIEGGDQAPRDLRRYGGATASHALRADGEDRDASRHRGARARGGAGLAGGDARQEAGADEPRRHGVVRDRGGPVPEGRHSDGGLRAGVDRTGAPARRVHRDVRNPGRHRLHASACG